MSWTDERVEQLRQAWLEGKSASTIASQLGDGLTRNAVIGKVHRLGLAGRAKSPAAAAAAPRVAPVSQSVRPAAHARPVATAAAAAGRMVRGATALAIQSYTMTAAQPREATESVVLPMSVRVTIVDLKESMCRWPLGDPTS
jgi:GcrA cell cycle regulator